MYVNDRRNVPKKVMQQKKVGRIRRGRTGRSNTKQADQRKMLYDRLFLEAFQVIKKQAASKTEEELKKSHDLINEFMRKEKEAKSSGDKAKEERNAAKRKKEEETREMLKAKLARQKGNDSKVEKGDIDSSVHHQSLSRTIAPPEGVSPRKRQPDIPAPKQQAQNTTANLIEKAEREYEEMQRKKSQQSEQRKTHQLTPNEFLPPQIIETVLNVEQNSEKPKPSREREQVKEVMQTILNDVEERIEEDKLEQKRKQWELDRIAEEDEEEAKEGPPPNLSVIGIPSNKSSPDDLEKTLTTLDESSKRKMQHDIEQANLENIKKHLEAINADAVEEELGLLELDTKGRKGQINKIPDIPFQRARADVMKDYYSEAINLPHSPKGSHVETLKDIATTLGHTNIPEVALGNFEEANKKLKKQGRKPHDIDLEKELGAVVGRKIHRKVPEVTQPVPTTEVPKEIIKQVITHPKVIDVVPPQIVNVPPKELMNDEQILARLKEISLGATEDKLGAVLNDKWEIQKEADAERHQLREDVFRDFYSTILKLSDYEKRMHRMEEQFNYAHPMNMFNSERSHKNDARLMARYLGLFQPKVSEEYPDKTGLDVAETGMYDASRKLPGKSEHDKPHKTNLEAELRDIFTKSGHNFYRVSKEWHQTNMILGRLIREGTMTEKQRDNALNDLMTNEMDPKRLTEDEKKVQLEQRERERAESVKAGHTWAEPAQAPGKGDTKEDGGIYVEEILRLLSVLIHKIHKFDVSVITNQTDKIQTTGKNMITIFLKHGHYTCACYRQDREEIAYFDPLAKQKRRELDTPQLQAFAQRISPDLSVKFKFNMNPWQGNIRSREDATWCGEYCVVFLHNYINLNENFKRATEFDIADKELLDELTLVDFPFI